MSSKNRSRRAVSANSSGKLAAPNPQGKGQIGFLRDWHDSAPRQVTEKPSGRILTDYFTSLLVLSADFKFRPVFESDYYLYYAAGRWSLSLLSPSDWNTREKDEAFVGTCTMHADATWSIAPSQNLTVQGTVADAIAGFYRAFVGRLDVPSPLEDELPFYAGDLPYYQRLFAAALSRSLRLSLRYGGQSDIPSRDWLSQLPTSGRRLLTGNAQKSD